MDIKPTATGIIVAVDGSGSSCCRRRRCHHRAPSIYAKKNLFAPSDDTPRHPATTPRRDIIFSDGKHKPFAAFNIIYTARVYYTVLYYYIVYARRGCGCAV